MRPAGLFREEVRRSAFVSAAAHFLAELNVIHCFREGNGRAQLSFLRLIAARARHPLKLELVKEATFLPAMIHSFAGTIGPLRTELAKLCVS